MAGQNRMVFKVPSTSHWSLIPQHPFTHLLEVWQEHGPVQRCDRCALSPCCKPDVGARRS